MYKIVYHFALDSIKPRSRYPLRGYASEPRRREMLQPLPRGARQQHTIAILSPPARPPTTSDCRCQIVYGSLNHAPYSTPASLFELIGVRTI